MRCIIGLLAALLVTAAFGAQTAVVEVPGAQAVRNAIQGGSARDRLARQSAAAFVLGNMVRVQAGERVKSGGLTAAESARIAELEALRDAADRDIESTLPANCRGGQNCEERYAFNRCMSAYQFSPAFYRAVYDRFFNAEAQKALSPKLTGAGTVWQGAIAMAPNSHPLASLPAPSKECAGGGAVVAAAAGAAAAGRIAVPVTVKANEHDESLKKARAAGVDTTVLGLKLGEAVRLPTCPDRGFMVELLNPGVDETCVMPNAPNMALANDLSVVLPGNQPAMPFDLTVELTKEKCPDWVMACQFQGRLVDGRLVAVFVLTNGLDVQDQVAAALTKKYRAWTTKGWYHFVNDTTGDKVDALDMSWALAGINVRFKGFTGGTRDAYGSVLVETDAVTRERANEEKARQDKKQQF